MTSPTKETKNFPLFSGVLALQSIAFLQRLPDILQFPSDMANSGKFGKRLILASCLHKQNVTFIFPISKILFLDLKSASGSVRVIWNSNSFIKKACLL